MMRQHSSAMNAKFFEYIPSKHFQPTELRSLAPMEHLPRSASNATHEPRKTCCIQSCFAFGLIACLEAGTEPFALHSAFYQISL